MAQQLTQADMGDILSAFERSDFANFELRVGTLRLAVSRARAEEASADTPADTADVTAPLLGFFQASDGAGSAPIVNPGSKVRPDTVVGFIRVMQKRFPVKAGRSGTLARVLVTDRQLVEYGQPLMKVVPDSTTEDSQ